jgi:heme-degrading monooxygenase HmoA
MIRSILFLRPVSGDFGSIERFFEAEQVLERAARTPGFVSAELHRPTDDNDVMLVTALWESPEAYQSWVDDPWRAAKRGPCRGGVRGGRGGRGRWLPLRVSNCGGGTGVQRKLKAQPGFRFKSSLGIKPGYGNVPALNDQSRLIGLAD